MSPRGERRLRPPTVSAGSSGAWALLLILSTLRQTALAVSIWEVGKLQGHVETRHDLPSSREFYDEYVRNTGGPFEGFGKPALFKGVAARMPAYKLWTDEYLREKHGRAHLDQVETEKKETRTKYPHEDWNVAKFLDNYKSSVVYSVSKVPVGLSDEVYLLPPMNCGGFQSKLSENILWMSSGDTKSVIHNDGQQNWHCMFAGRKEWILWHPKAPVNSKKLGWVLAEQEAQQDPTFADAYGQFAGKVDVDNVDLEKFPGWNDLPWWNMTLEAGDCAFIPAAWFHFVQSPPERAISMHVWFHEEKAFDQRSCDKLKSDGFNASELLLRLSDCTFGYDKAAGKKAKKTKCRLPTPAPRATSSSEL